MQRSEILEHLRHYISGQVLNDEDIGLNEKTPLLEWGIINSLEIVRLLDFIQQQFEVTVPVDKMVADSFVNIASIADLVVELAQIHPAGQQAIEID